MGAPARPQSQPGPLPCSPAPPSPCPSGQVPLGTGDGGRGRATSPGTPTFEDGDVDGWAHAGQPPPLVPIDRADVRAGGRRGPGRAAAVHAGPAGQPQAGPGTHGQHQEEQEGRGRHHLVGGQNRSPRVGEEDRGGGGAPGKESPAPPPPHGQRCAPFSREDSRQIRSCLGGAGQWDPRHSHCHPDRYPEWVPAHPHWCPDVAPEPSLLRHLRDHCQ